MEKESSRTTSSPKVYFPNSPMHTPSSEPLPHSSQQIESLSPPLSSQQPTLRLLSSVLQKSPPRFPAADQITATIPHKHATSTASSQESVVKTVASASTAPRQSGDVPSQQQQYEASSTSLTTAPHPPASQRPTSEILSQLEHQLCLAADPNSASSQRQSQARGQQAAALRQNAGVNNSHNTKPTSPSRGLALAAAAALGAVASPHPKFKETNPPATPLLQRPASEKPRGGFTSSVYEGVSSLHPQQNSADIRVASRSKPSVQIPPAPTRPDLFSGRQQQRQTEAEWDCRGDSSQHQTDHSRSQPSRVVVTPTMRPTSRQYLEEAMTASRVPLAVPITTGHSQQQLESHGEHLVHHDRDQSNRRPYHQFIYRSSPAVPRRRSADGYSAGSPRASSTTPTSTSRQPGSGHRSCSTVDSVHRKHSTPITAMTQPKRRVNSLDPKERVNPGFKYTSPYPESGDRAAIHINGSSESCRLSSRVKSETPQQEAAGGLAALLSHCDIGGRLKAYNTNRTLLGDGIADRRREFRGKSSETRHFGTCGVEHQNHQTRAATGPDWSGGGGLTDLLKHHHRGSDDEGEDDEGLVLQNLLEIISTTRPKDFVSEGPGKGEAGDDRGPSSVHVGMRPGAKCLQTLSPIVAGWNASPLSRISGLCGLAFLVFAADIALAVNSRSVTALSKLLLGCCTVLFLMDWIFQLIYFLHLRCKHAPRFFPLINSPVVPSTGSLTLNLLTDRQPTEGYSAPHCWAATLILTASIATIYVLVTTVNAEWIMRISDGYLMVAQAAIVKALAFCHFLSALDRDVLSSRIRTHVSDWRSSIKCRTAQGLSGPDTPPRKEKSGKTSTSLKAVGTSEFAPSMLLQLQSETTSCTSQVSGPSTSPQQPLLSPHFMRPAPPLGTRFSKSLRNVLLGLAVSALLSLTIPPEIKELRRIDSHLGRELETLQQLGSTAIDSHSKSRYRIAVSLFVNRELKSEFPLLYLSLPYAITREVELSTTPEAVLFEGLVNPPSLAAFAWRSSAFTAHWVRGRSSHGLSYALVKKVESAASAHVDIAALMIWRGWRAAVICLTIILLFSVCRLCLNKALETGVIHPVRSLTRLAHTIREEPLKATQLEEVVLWKYLMTYLSQNEVTQRSRNAGGRGVCPVSSRSFRWFRLRDLLTRRTRLAGKRRELQQYVSKQEEGEILMLEQTIARIATLTLLGFGEAGAAVITQAIRQSLSPLTQRFPFASVAEPRARVEGGQYVEAVFGFVDIREFAGITEALGREVLTFVNDVASIVHNVADDFNGVANKSVGDAFFLVWKLPNPPSANHRLCSTASTSRPQPTTTLNISPDRLPAAVCTPIGSSRGHYNGDVYLTQHHDDYGGDPSAARASAACRVADLATLAAVKILTGIATSPAMLAYRSCPKLRNRFGDGFTVRVGIGLHFGWAIEGAIGTDLKIDASYLGQDVNIASRLESVTKVLGTPLLISESVASLTSPLMRKQLRLIDRLSLCGTIRAIDVYTLDLELQQALPVNSQSIRAALKPATVCPSPVEGQNAALDIVRQLMRRREKRVIKRRLLDHELEASELLEADSVIARCREGCTQEWIENHTRAVRLFCSRQWAAAAQILRRHLVKDSGMIDIPSRVLLDYMDDHKQVCPLSWPGHRKLLHK